MPRRESVPRLRPGLSLSRASACGLGAARAAGVPRAFELLDSSGLCPCLLARRLAVRCAGFDRPCCARLCVRAPSSMLGAQSPCSTVARRRAGCYADFSTAAFFLSSAGPMRRSVLPCPWSLGSAGLAFGGPNPCRKAVAAWMLPVLLVLYEELVRSHGLVFERESWRGHGTPSLRCRCVAVRLGLDRRNRPAQEISPALRAFLARQISRACRSSTLFRPFAALRVRRARHLA